MSYSDAYIDALFDPSRTHPTLVINDRKYPFIAYGVLGSGNFYPWSPGTYHVQSDAEVASHVQSIPEAIAVDDLLARVYYYAKTGFLYDSLYSKDAIIAVLERRYAEYQADVAKAISLPPPAIIAPIEPAPAYAGPAVLPKSYLETVTPQNYEPQHYFVNIGGEMPGVYVQPVSAGPVLTEQAQYVGPAGTTTGPTPGFATVGFGKLFGLATGLILVGSAVSGLVVEHHRRGLMPRSGKKNRRWPFGCRECAKLPRGQKCRRCKHA